jgi:multidrug efflux pump subunit AcrB
MVVRLQNGSRPAMNDIMDEVRQNVQQSIPNIEVDLVPILGDLIGDMAGSPSPIEVKVFGPDIQELMKLAKEVGARVSSINGVVDEADGIIMSGPDTTMHVDPLRASEHGLSANSITSAAQGALDGDVVGTVRRGELLEPIRVMYPYHREGSIQTLADLAIINPNGQPVPLSSVADIQTSSGTPQLNRDNQRLMLSVTARLSGRDLGSAVQAVKNKLKDMVLPPGYSIEYGGLYKSQQESFGALGAVLAAAAILVFTVLVFTFRAFRIAISLFIAALLSLFGVVLALWITGTPLNISSYTGAIMIVGIVTENGVLLFDELTRRRKEKPNAALTQLLVESGEARLRPILMTTCAAILTLFPLALGIGAGAAMQKPLAIAVIGGLTLSMVFTLLLAPAIFSSLSDFKSKIPTQAKEEGGSDIFNIQ